MTHAIMLCLIMPREQIEWTILKGSLIIMASIFASLPAADAQQPPVEIFRTDGEVSRDQSGWTYEAGAGGGTVYLPLKAITRTGAAACNRRCSRLARAMTGPRTIA